MATIKFNSFTIRYVHVEGVDRLGIQVKDYGETSAGFFWDEDRLDWFPILTETKNFDVYASDTDPRLESALRKLWF